MIGLLALHHARLAADAERGVVEQTKGVGRGRRQLRGTRGPVRSRHPRYGGAAGEHGLERGPSRDAHDYTPVFVVDDESSGGWESFFEATYPPPASAPTMAPPTAVAIGLTVPWFALIGG